MAFCLPALSNISGDEPKDVFFGDTTARNPSLPGSLDAKTKTLLEISDKARRRYFAEKYKGPVAVFQSEQVLHNKDIYSKWKQAVPEGIHYYAMIEGASHYDLFFNTRYYTLLAEKLNSVLLEFHANFKKQKD
jgi:hypothetical protein